MSVKVRPYARGVFIAIALALVAVGSTPRARSSAQAFKAPVLLEVIMPEVTRAGEPVRFKVSAKSPAPHQPIPTGQVELWSGTALVASAPLESTEVSACSLTADFGVGEHVLTVRYTGDATFQATESIPSTLTVLQ